MNIKREIKKALTILMAVAVLLGGLPTRAYAAKKNEYAKWKIKKIDGKYFYKQKTVRLLLDDTGKKTVTNKFFFNKKGTVDIEIIRNKKGRIEKIKYISKKRAKQIIKNHSTAYYIDKPQK